MKIRDERVMGRRVAAAIGGAAMLLATVMTTGGTPASASVELVPGSPGEVLATGGIRSAEIAYNPDRDEYMVVHADEGTATAVRVTPDGTPIGTPIVIGAASDFGFPDIAYNSNSQRYFITWVRDGNGPTASLQSVWGTVLDGEGTVLGSGVLHGSLGDEPACTARYSRVVSDDDSDGFAVLYTYWYGSETLGFNCGGLAPTGARHVLQLVDEELALGDSTSLNGLGFADFTGSLARHPVTGDYLVGQPVGVDASSVRATTLDADLNVLGSGPLVDDMTLLFQTVGDPDSNNWIGVGGGTAESRLLAPDASTLREAVPLSATPLPVTDVVAMGNGTFVAASTFGPVVQFGTDGEVIFTLNGTLSGFANGPTAIARGGDENTLLEVGRTSAGELIARPLFVTAPGALPVTPGRVLDTRASGETVDGEFEAIGIVTGGSEVMLQVAGRAGVPTDAVAAFLNIAATGATGDGFVTAYPCGATRPTTSNLNFGAGGASSAGAIVTLDDDGRACVFTSVDAHLIADVTAYLPAISSVTPIVPARLADTRPTGKTVDGDEQAGGVRTDGQITTFRIAGRGGIADDATAALLNVTAIRPDGRAFLTVFPCGQPQPQASTLNAETGTVVNNLVLAQLGDDGTVCVFTSAGTHVSIDASAFVPSGGGLRSVVPARLLETRVSAPPTIDGAFSGQGRRSAESLLRLEVGGRGGVPDGATGVMLNITVVNPSDRGFVTAYSCADDQPLTASVNHAAGGVVANAVFVPIDSRGDLCVFTSAETDLVVDVNGFVLDN